MSEWTCEFGCTWPGFIPETDDHGYEVMVPCQKHKPEAYVAFMDGLESFKSYWNGRGKKKTEEQAQAESKAREAKEWA